eukprot:m.9644 g.9644  ORF g.9644 m.9644 type:complete len:229 (+) comp4104_c0_seq1:815-1501(+)
MKRKHKMKSTKKKKKKKKQSAASNVIVGDNDFELAIAALQGSDRSDDFLDAINALKNAPENERTANRREDDNDDFAAAIAALQQLNGDSHEYEDAILALQNAGVTNNEEDEFGFENPAPTGHDFEAVIGILNSSNNEDHDFDVAITALTQTNDDRLDLLENEEDEGGYLDVVAEPQEEIPPGMAVNPLIAEAATPVYDDEDDEEFSGFDSESENSDGVSEEQQGPYFA